MLKQVASDAKDKVFRLKNRKSPWYSIQHKSTKRKPLIATDPKKGIRREIRYSASHITPWIDEQEGEPTILPITFIDGMLTVDKNDLALLNFLSVHPDLGRVFEELDSERDAAEELVQLENEADAFIQARQLTVEEADVIGKIIFGKKAGEMSTKELRRDLIVYAKKSPAAFLSALNDPEKNKRAAIQEFFDTRLIQFRDKNQYVHYNLKDNKKRMMTLPPNVNDPMTIITKWFTDDDEGVEAYKMLSHILENDMS